MLVYLASAKVGFRLYSSHDRRIVGRCSYPIGSAGRFCLMKDDAAGCDDRRSGLAIHRGERMTNPVDPKESRQLGGRSRQTLKYVVKHKKKI